MLTSIITYVVFFAAVYMTCLLFARLADAVVKGEGNVGFVARCVAALWTVFIILKDI